MNGGILRYANLIEWTRTGKIKVGGGNGFVVYNSKWFAENHPQNGREAAEWVYNCYADMHACSACGSLFGERYNFCPNCGAKMEMDGEK